MLPVWVFEKVLIVAPSTISHHLSTAKNPRTAFATAMVWKVHHW
jgi:hypothetical protein